MALGLSISGRSSGSSSAVGLIDGNNGVVVLFGDSLEQHTGTGVQTAGSEETSNWSRGAYNWCRMIDPRGKWFNWYDNSQISKYFQGQNQGIGGNETSQMRSRIANVTNFPNLGVVIMGGGTNDLNASRANSQILGDINFMIDAIKAKGAKIILMTPPPRTLANWASGSAIRTNWLALCESYQAIADADPTNIKIVRRDLICGLTDADRTPKTGYLQSDGTHLTPLASYHIAADPYGLIDRLAQFVDQQTIFPTTSMTGEMVVNTSLTGSGGSVLAPCTGIAPDGMRIQRSAGSTITAAGSRQTLFGIDMYKIDITNPGTGTGTESIQIDMNGNISAGLPAVGTWMQAAFKVRWAGSANLNSVTGRARQQPSTPANMDAFSLKTDTGLLWENADMYGPDGKGVWQFSPPFQIRTGCTSILFNVTINVDARVAGSQTVWIPRMTLHQISDPRPALGF